MPARWMQHSAAVVVPMAGTWRLYGRRCGWMWAECWLRVWPTGSLTMGAYWVHVIRRRMTYPRRCSLFAVLDVSTCPAGRVLAASVCLASSHRLLTSLSISLSPPPPSRLPPWTSPPSPRPPPSSIRVPSPSSPALRESPLSTVPSPALNLHLRPHPRTPHFRGHAAPSHRRRPP